MNIKEMDVLKQQIKNESQQTVTLSREATNAFRDRDWERTRELRERVLAASKRCQELIRQLIERNN